MVVKSLHKGKSITANADVYYQTSGGMMVTHFFSPFEQIIITNSKGEYKNYDVKNNTLIQSHGIDFSSKNSFFYFFLSGKSQDMGLATQGYKLQNTRVENGMVISIWIPPANTDVQLSRIELVHEKFTPIYMGLFNLQGNIEQKVYYSNYQEAQGILLPMNITEFQYLADGDSVISRRSYSNLKLNEQVDNTYLNYKIPANAKVVLNHDMK